MCVYVCVCGCGCVWVAGCECWTVAWLQSCLKQIFGCVKSVNSCTSELQLQDDVTMNLFFILNTSLKQMTLSMKIQRWRMRNNHQVHVHNYNTDRRIQKCTFFIKYYRATTLKHRQRHQQGFGCWMESYMFATTEMTTISSCHATYLARFASEGLFSSRALPEAFVPALEPRLFSTNLLHYFPCLSPL